MKLVLFIFLTNISFASLSQTVETFYDFKPCYNSKIICSVYEKDFDELISKGIEYKFNNDKSYVFVKVFNNKKICISKGQYKMYEVDTIKTFRIITSEGITKEIIRGVRKVFYKEGTWFYLVKGKLNMEYFQKGEKVKTNIPYDN